MGHTGHDALVQAVIHQAENTGATPYFFVSRSFGKEDPIPPETKLAMYQKKFPKYAKMFSLPPEGMTTLNSVLDDLKNKGYTDATIVVGENEKDSFNYLIKPDSSGVPSYKNFGWNNITVMSRQDTKAPGSDKSKPDYHEGPRATPMRQVLLDPDKTEQEQFAVWRQAMSPSLDDSEVLDMMNTAKQNLIQFHTKKPRRKASDIKEHLAKMRPLLKEASVEQKYKMLKLLKEFHYRSVEPTEFNAFIENDEGMAEGEQDPQSELKMINQKLKDAYKRVRNNSSASIGWYMSEVKALKSRREELIKQLRQGVAEGSLNEYKNTTLEQFDGLEFSFVKDDPYIKVRAFAPKTQREIAQVDFKILDNDGLEPQDLHVEERFRGQGIAKIMYDFVKSKGYKIHRSWSQTDAGADFWDKHRGQERVWEQGVAEKMKMGATIEPMEDKEKSDPVVDATLKFYKPVMQKASEQEVDHYVEKAKHLLQKTDDPVVRKKLIDIFKEGKHNPYLQGGIITAIAALLGGGAINLANNIQLTPYQTNLMMQGILNSIVPAVGARMSGKNWVDTLKYTLASLGVGVGIATVMEKDSDVIGHVAKDLAGDGAPIAKLRAARDAEQMKKRERSDGLPVEPKFDYLDEK
jgi:GNAT superfamily N-acetyltransferase